ncbi:MAG: DUF1127 domain-containing protein [Kiloniellaceae bacterium]
MDTILRTARASLAPRGAAFPDSRWGGPSVRQRGSYARRGALLLVDMLIVWQKRLGDRDALSHMGPDQLKDIGLSREDALREAEKPFWRR